MKNIPVIILLIFLYSNFTLANDKSFREIEGFKFKKKVSVNKETLLLNGLGTRTVSFFNIKAFSAALYVKTKTQDPEKIINSKFPKRIEIRFLKNLSASMVANAWTKELLKRCSSKCDPLEKKVLKLGSYMLDFKKKDSLTFDFHADKLDVFIRGKNKGSIQGNNFTTSFLSLWIGKNPLSQELKEALLN